jgi:hypothetical protein
MEKVETGMLGDLGWAEIVAVERTMSVRILLNILSSYGFAKWIPACPSTSLVHAALNASGTSAGMTTRDLFSFTKVALRQAQGDFLLGILFLASY